MLNTDLFNQSPQGGTWQPSVLHVVLQGTYQVDTPNLNRVYFAGKDETGNPVTHDEQDSAELALVGERLRFRFDSGIATAALAEQIAAAVLAKQRLNQRSGSVIIPPHCGIELFDVISVYDPQAAQAPQLWRVTGIRFQYDAQEAVFQQQLTLSAV